MDIQVTTPDERIQDLLTSALEGGSNYWYFIEKYNYPKGKSEKDFQFPQIELPFAGGSLIISYIENGKNEDGEHETYILDYTACQHGLQRMSQRYPSHFGDFLSENDDSIIGDTFLQLATLGELVYG